MAVGWLRCSELGSSPSLTRPSERDLFIGGDFNLVPGELQQAVSQPVETEGSGSTLNQQIQITENLYDHILIHDEAASQEVINHRCLRNLLLD